MFSANMAWRRIRYVLNSPPHPYLHLRISSDILPKLLRIWLMSRSKNSQTQADYIEITISPWVAFSAVAIVAIIVFGAVYIFTHKGAGQSQTGGSQAQVQQEQNKIVFPAKVENSPVLGKDSAPVTIFEFSDLECPFCRAFYYGMPSRGIKGAWSEIEKLIKEGKVRYVHKNFVAVPSHNPAAKLEAQATYCVYKLGGTEKYYEYIHKVFEKAGRAGSGYSGTYQSGGAGRLKEELAKLASSMKIDKGKFLACINSAESEKLYKQDEKYIQDVITPKASQYMQQGKLDGLGTPMFIICKTPKDNNTECQGEVLMGAYPFSYFERIINKLK